MLWIQFLICVIIVVAASSVLSRYADVIAEKTGLGRAWVGAILLAGVTSLPELVSGVTAVTVLNAPNLAIGGIVGSNLFNLTLIAVMDVAYQPGSILSRAQDGHILSGGLGILLMGLIAMRPAGRPGLKRRRHLRRQFHQRGDCRLVLDRRAPAVDLSEQAGRGSSGTGSRSAALRSHQPPPRVSHLRRRRAGGGGGRRVAVRSLADQISAATGLGRSFVGALLLGVSTSLPEITASLTAVRIGAIDLAIGNVLGSNLFNVTLLAVYDVFDGGANLWAVMSNANALGLIIAMMMTAVVIISLMYRASPKTPWRMNWDGVALIVMYLGAMAALYILG